MTYHMAESDILAAWETGAPRRPLDRALAVLWAAGAGGADPAGLPIAERDRRLLTVRAATFGAVLPTRATCPDCSTELELDLDAGTLAGVLPGSDGETARYQITSRDLAAVADMDPAAVPSALRQMLLPDLGGKAAHDAEARIVEEAEATELTARLTCEDCGHEWVEAFDVTAHVWAEVECAALALLRDVAEIAAVFGWTEDEILSLSPKRRSVYLAMLRQA